MRQGRAWGVTGLTCQLQGECRRPGRLGQLAPMHVCSCSPQSLTPLVCTRPSSLRPHSAYTGTWPPGTSW